MTHRRFKADKLVVASHNAGKLREIADLIRPFGIEAISAAALGLPEPDETGTTFAANAEIKAHAAATAAQMPALSDDSGLCVDALNGAPGIYSARWAGPTKDFSVAMTRLERELNERNVPSQRRSAHFVCALTLAWADGHAETFEGQIEGRLVFPPRGTKGFGYDPVFVPNGFDMTFGEMDPERKHKMSHRARAFAKLIAACFVKG